MFLDEIGELPPPLQAKLLRVLQEREVKPLGSSQQVPIDVRVVSATNRDLDAACSKTSSFASDLYYRLNVVQIHIPPLRERPEDIMPLASHLLERAAPAPGQARQRACRRQAARRCWRTPGRAMCASWKT